MAEDDFAHALKRRRQISITVTGRRTGRAVTIPVWFVADDHALWLLPVYGSKTQWYQNLEKPRDQHPRRNEKRRLPCKTPERRAGRTHDRGAVSRKVYSRGNQTLVQGPGCCGPDSLRLCGISELRRVVPSSRLQTNPILDTVYSLTWFKECCIDDGQ